MRPCSLQSYPKEIMWHSSFFVKYVDKLEPKNISGG